MQTMRWTIAAVVLTTLARASAADAYLNFFAESVEERIEGPGSQPYFADPQAILGGPEGGGQYSGSGNVVRLGEGGSVTLGFDSGKLITDAPGDDLIVFENAFVSDTSGWGTGTVYAELVYVEVSSDGTHFARFPVHCDVPEPLGPYGGISAADVDGFAGVGPVMVNVATGVGDPFDPATAGGDAFDLADLAEDPNVQAGLVDLNRVRYVRLVDVIGDGRETDAEGNPIYDPFGYYTETYWDWDVYPPRQVTLEITVSADVDAVSVVHGLQAGDANRDGRVTAKDYLTCKRNFGREGGWEDGDFTGDGLVDREDLNVLAEWFGAAPAPPAPSPPAAALPEPTTAVLLLPAAAGLLRRRRHGTV